MRSHCSVICCTGSLFSDVSRHDLYFIDRPEDSFFAQQIIISSNNLMVILSSRLYHGIIRMLIAYFHFSEHVRMQSLTNGLFVREARHSFCVADKSQFSVRCLILLVVLLLVCYLLLPCYLSSVNQHEMREPSYLLPSAFFRLSIDQPF